MAAGERWFPRLTWRRRHNLTDGFEPPIRAEVFGLDRLEAYARTLAEAAVVRPGRGRGRPLLDRFTYNRRALLAAQQRFGADLRAERALPPAAEWLLDNFYIVQTHMQQVARDLSAGFYRELPKLAAGLQAGYPRVYPLALELLAHTDSRLDEETLARFVAAYQTVQPLTTGELWAVPIMLRLCLIENLRRLVGLALVAHEKRRVADEWAGQLLRAAGGPPAQVMAAMAGLARGPAALDSVFVVQLLERLRDQTPAIAPAVQWLESWFGEQGTSLEALTRHEHQRRAANRVSIGNVITSLRALNTIDWAEFFEAHSAVEAELRRDPLGAYAAMDFATRDLYRHAVESLARRARRPEAPVAAAANDLAAAAPPAAGDARRRHNGYYLLNDGRPALEAAVGARALLSAGRRAALRPLVTPLYLGALLLLTVALTALPVRYAATHGVSGLALAALALLAALPVSTLAVSTVNWLLTLSLPPARLPKLDFVSPTSGGLPAAARTMVVVPCLINTASGIERLFDNLEVRFLANRDPHLHFALLGDFADARDETRPEDAELLAVAERRVAALNAQYGEGRADRFYFFNRRRTWNPQQGVWMGWERKRGKLLEFNRLLRGDSATHYTALYGDLSLLREVQYVITLDADTDLPLASAARLAGAMAHPLNRPVIDPRRRVVTAGYGILQPRVAVNALAASETRFSRLFAGEAGLDPYSNAVSMVYQDLFDSGNYIGKAIYSVDACLAVLDGRFPENQLLSHDLLEGSYVRAGQLTDVQLLEDFPTGYDAYAQRAHRWMRGDWQIAEWVTPWVTGPDGRPVRNPLPALARWKFLDNLRVSLVPPAAFLLLVLGWTVLPGRPSLWTAAALLPLMLPEIWGLVLTGGVHPAGETWPAYLRSLVSDAARALGRAVFGATMLLFEAGNSLDAIGRVFVRRGLTHRQLLEWNSAAAVERGQARTLVDYGARLAASPALAAGLFVLLVFNHPAALPEAAPFLALWALAPVVGWWISRPPAHPRTQPLPEAAQRELRLTARRIWRFYEAFAGPDDHWLPPDNYQEEPNTQVAHRTSPTNIGFLLLAALAAYDFGYLDASALTEWFERVLGTLRRLERFRGHLFNWYDTTTLKPLAPEYISMVDSGNLAAALVTIKQACAELPGAPAVLPNARAGLEDTLAALRAALTEWQPNTAAGRAARGALHKLAAESAARLAGNEPWLALLAALEPLAATLAQQAAALAVSAEPTDAANPAHVQAWAEAYLSLVRVRRAAGSDPALGHAAAPSWAALAEDGHAPAADLLARLAAVAEAAEALLAQMDFSFLYRADRGLFAIGYSVAAQRLDASDYDLLASEARLGSLVAIARGQVPARHWFRLGRPLTWAGDSLGGSLALLSWGGTMFEYLMPGLLLAESDHTLLAQTAVAVIQAQRHYAAGHRVPWGISESGYYAFDYQFSYQYQSFGVPGLGLKRDLGDNLVIAPYATLLALPYRPAAAYANLQRLAAEGLSGPFGYYEAIDYTPTRRPRGQRAGVVQSYMAHHQGMGLVALDNALNGGPMPRRFHAEPAIAAVELLLQERVPRHVALIDPHPEAEVEGESGTPNPLDLPAASRWYGTPHTPAPRTLVLSNGAYEVMVTNAGGGYSAYLEPGAAPGQTLALTRWRADATRDQWGSFIYIQDAASRQAWSAAYQPLAREPERYEVVFGLDRAHYLRRDAGIETRLDIVVSPRDPVELRRLTLTNLGRQPRTLTVTSYAEVALDSVGADLAHPAFSKLFVESERLPDRPALLFHRRPRATGQQPPWALHLLSTAAPLLGAVEHETDRARFVGRGRSAADPAALGGALSGTTGAVLDPIMSLRGTVRLAPGESVEVAFVTGLAATREAALALADKYSDRRALGDALDLAWVYSQIQLRHLNITAEDAHLFQRLAARMLYPDAALRAPAALLASNTRGQSGLWSLGLSGDHPILLARVDDPGELDLVRQLLRAHEYWRLNNFTVDLVILNAHAVTYAEGLQGDVQSLIDTSLSRPWQDKPGGVFVRRADHLPPADLTLLLTAARVVLDGDLGSLAEQLGPPAPAAAHSAPALPRPRPTPPAEPARVPATAPLEFDNGLGGFTPDGREYVITLRPGQWTPAPWINVLANEQFGALVTDTGLGYTWAENSQQNRLTPWSNDPVSDPPGEVLYLRDDDTGAVWTPTPLPIREASGDYVIAHGAGYTRYERTSAGLSQTLTVCVPPDAPVKLMRLTLRNPGRRPRRLTVTAYVEWVLGALHANTQYFTVTERDAETGAVFARNTYNTDYPERVAFLHLSAAGMAAAAVTGDRTAFIGRNRSLARPAALEWAALDGQTGAGLDPCGAAQGRVEVPPGGEVDVVVVLGQARDAAEARRLIGRYRQPGAAQAALAAGQAHWDELLGAVQVSTPDRALNHLLNRWLLYQALACRIWGRSAFYQSGGAYGFRDQLQDGLALTWAAPEVARAHLLRAAARQFAEGDVQHWWHPATGQGVRTRFSDDYLWLPFAVAHYVAATGDRAVLDEPVPFLKAPVLEPDQHEAFVAATLGPSASLYEHCRRALDHALDFGPHGLPRMGIGDWNDGMNLVGAGGQGESVWLAWFLLTNLNDFAALAEGRGEADAAERYRTTATRLQEALEAHAWDGAWYRRAYYDDGTPLGTATADECQIDSIAQSWAVLSGAAPAERAQQAMQSLAEKLVRPEDGLILLLTPPFNTTAPSPGYIQGYVPGIRENGGQYTHAALWAIWAKLQQGDGDTAAAWLRLINPIYHADTPEAAARYKVEPYVIAADVYSHPQHVGRGGWTWYTGSAAWMYRVGVEALLGLRRHGDAFSVEPCIPADWEGFSLTLTFGQSRYAIEVRNPAHVSRGVAEVTLDNQALPDRRVPLRADGQPHHVRVTLGAA